MKESTVHRLDLDDVPVTGRDARAPQSLPMDVVGHVKVRLTARLGQVELPIAKLLSLTAGDVLKLEETVEEPIVLLVDGKPVARGELVAVDDCFGIRVTDVA